MLTVANITMMLGGDWREATQPSKPIGEVVTTPLVEGFLCARHHAKCPMTFISFNPHLSREVLLSDLQSQESQSGLEQL